MNLIILDLGLLAVIILVASIFLYKNRKKLGKDGPLILYRTKWGIKFINKTGKKYKKSLKFLSYVSIITGYILMVLMVWLFVRVSWEYVTNPAITETIKAPPIAPLIPYFPQLFGLGDFFPAFYAVYFIVAVLIVMSVHEFSHGIFAKKYGIKIKSTGFAFLKYFPAIFGAFVEQDEKQMNKTKKFGQMSVLTAGVFANIITAILFFGILIFYFNASFSALGVGFVNYAYTDVKISEINSVNGVSIENANRENVLMNLKNETLNTINVDGKTYLATVELVEMQNWSNGEIFLFEDAPAINAGLRGAIFEIDGIKINGEDDFKNELLKHKPGETANFKTNTGEKIEEYKIKLDENPKNNSLPYLGISSFESKNYFMTEFGHFFSSLKKENLYVKGNVYYKPKTPEISEFFYYMIWWVVFINILVGLFNMLPLGILDGGRFFYLTVWGITKNEKIGKKSYALITYFLLFLLALILVKWILARF